MAATKKKISPKKSKTAKATKSAKSTHSRWSWRFSFISLGMNLLIVATVVVLAFLLAQFITSQQNQARLDRINGIYASLQLNLTYVPQTAGTEVFGDKRPYSNDKTRSHASIINYIHNQTMSETFNELDMKIKQAGFTKLDVTYSPMVNFLTQAQYKSSKGEYIRITVESRQFAQAVFNSHYLGTSSQPVTLTELRQKYDINAAPSNVAIKVNLDDNNE